MRCAPRYRRGLVAGAALALAVACAPPTAPVEAPVPTPPPAPGLPRAEPELRVGLLVDTASVQLSSTAGFELSDGPSGRTLGRAPAGERWTVAADGGGALQVTGPAGGAVATTQGPLLIHPTAGGRLLLGDRPYRGSAIVRAAGPGRLTAINLVQLEEYLLGVVPHEIGRVGEDLLEAAKAQAVAARTYAIGYRGRREALGFDVFATVQDQVYGGAGEEHEVTSRAVRETAGEVLLFAGLPIQAYYHSTCAGQTAAIEEVWLTELPRPYLVSVVDVNPATGEAWDHFSSRFRWTQRWTAAQLTEIFARTLADSVPAGRQITEIRDMRVLERTQSDRIRRMLIETDAGTVHVGSDRIRWIFLTPEGRILNSSKFDVELIRDASGRLNEVVATGMGWGHGIGMCQVGAMGRARAGQSYRTILQTYYPGTELRRLY